MNSMEPCFRMIFGELWCMTIMEKAHAREIITTLLCNVIHEVALSLATGLISKVIN